MPGPVYDLDYIRNSGWVQVLAHGTPPGPAAVTRDAACASLLAAAYVSRREVRLLTRPGLPPEVAVVEILPPMPLPLPPPNEWAIGRVVQFVMPYRMEVEFLPPGGPPIHGHDMSGLAQPVIEAALASGESVEYLTIAPTGEILRVKVNH